MTDLTVTTEFEGETKRRIYVNDKHTRFYIDYRDGQWALYENTFGYLFRCGYVDSGLLIFTVIARNVMDLEQQND